MGNRIIKYGVFAFAICAISSVFALPQAQDMGLPLQWSPETSIALAIKETIKYVGVLAVIALSWGGIQFLISAGEEQRVKSAKSIVIYALVGVLLSITAYTMVDIIIAFRIS